MASRLSVEPVKLLATLKATVFKGATDEELLALVVVANEYNLSPFLREIYAFPSKGGGITPIVSVDGWNKMLINNPRFDGYEFEFEKNEDGSPASCTMTIHVKERAHPVRITEYFAECFRNTDNWKNMPFRMLRNRTLCQGSRLAFGFSGVYHEDEAETISVEATIIPSEPPPKLVAAPPDNGITPQAELEANVVNAGFNLGHVIAFGKQTGNLENVDDIKSFADLPTDACKRFNLPGARVNFLKALKKLKEATP